MVEGESAGFYGGVCRAEWKRVEVKGVVEMRGRGWCCGGLWKCSV